MKTKLIRAKVISINNYPMSHLFSIVAKSKGRTYNIPVEHLEHYYDLDLLKRAKHIEFTNTEWFSDDFGFRFTFNCDGCKNEVLFNDFENNRIAECKEYDCKKELLLCSDCNEDYCLKHLKKEVARAF